MDVIILARLSQKKKGMAQSGIYSQDEDARDWAGDEGHNVVDTVADHISGTTAMWDRPHARPWVTQPDLMVKYQGIVAAKQDRLSREDWSQEARLRLWAEEHGKTLFIVDKDMRWPPRKGIHHDDDVSNWNRGAEQARREWTATSNRFRRNQKFLRDNNLLHGRPPYGYRVMGVKCKETPCRCWDLREEEDRKTLKIHEPEAQYVREAVRRYLAGETIDAICNDFNARKVPSPMWRGKPGTRWYGKTLADILRSPSIAGRRYARHSETGELKTQLDKPPVLTYEGIISWTDHEKLVARLDSRAHRKGISPGNARMLTGIMIDEAGHGMHPIKGRPTKKGTPSNYYCRECKGLLVLVEIADEFVSNEVIGTYGELPHMIRRIIPGKNNLEEIAKKRQERNELDDTAGDYVERVAAITAEINELRRQDEEEPQPDRLAWVPTGKTIAEYWQSLDDAGRRDWLKENGWTVKAIKDDKMPGGWHLFIDAGWTGDVEREITSLGFPLDDYYRTLAELPQRLGIPALEVDANQKG